MRLIKKLFGKIKIRSIYIINKLKTFNKIQEHNVQFQEVKTDRSKGVNNDLDSDVFFQKVMNENYNSNI